MRVTAALLLFLLVAGCAGARQVDETPAAPTPPLLVPGPDHRSFDATMAREIELVVDADDPRHVTMAYIIPRSDPNFPSWDAIAKSHDAGATWTVRPLCGDPRGAPATIDPNCFFFGARLTSDPVLTRLSDGTILLVGVALNAQDVTQFAARYAADALAPTSVHVVSRSSLNAFPGAQNLPAPYMAYYNGKANVMQARDEKVHLVWAADLVGPTDDVPVTGLPYWTTSADGGRTWSRPAALSSKGYGDVGSVYAVGVQAFQTLDDRLHAIWWESRTNALYQVDATDGAASAFTPVRKIADAMGRPPRAPVNSDNLTRPWVVVDDSDGPWRGRVYLLYDDLSLGDRDLYLLVSRDNATTWSDPFRIPTIPVDNGRDETMARLLMEPSGALSVLYPSWKNLERWSPYEMRLARSVDGGQNWTDVLLSSELSPLNNPGDYNDLEVVAGGILAVWEDGRGTPSGGRWAWQSLIPTG